MTKIKDSVEWITTALGIMCSGAVLVPADPQLADSQLRQQAVFTDAKAAICSGSFQGVYDDTCRVCSLKDFFAKAGEFPADPPPEREARGDRPSMIVFTSGTMGNPKGVMLSEVNIMASLNGGLARLDPAGKVFAMLPLNHAYAFLCGVFGALGKGETVVVNDRLRKFIPNMQKHRPGMMFIVPMVLEEIRKKILMEAEAQGKLARLQRGRKISRALLCLGIDVRRIIFRGIHQQLGGKMCVFVSGGAPLNEELQSFFTDIGFEVLNGYGITECAPLVAVVSNKEGSSRHSSQEGVGHPTPSCRVRILDPDENGQGEICVEGDNTMMGYYHNDEATEKAFDGSWLRTGDIGCLDSRGNLHILGRTKNMILLDNGKNVYPEELEELLLESPDIAEAVVYLNDSRRITAEVYCGDTARGRDEVRKWILRRQTESSGFSEIDLSRMKFMNRFMTRKPLRERGLTVILSVGMFLSILIMVMGFSVKGSIDYYVAETDRDLQFEYLYLLKYPLDYVPKNAEEAYTESLRTEYAATGGTAAVTLQGIKRGSDYFGFEPAADQNSVIISNSAAIKFGLKEGDQVCLTDEMTGKSYQFAVKGVTKYTNGCYMFMDIDSMRERFGREDDYFNTLFAGQTLRISDSDAIASVISQKDVSAASTLFIDQMAGTILLLIVLAIMVMIITVFLLINIMIEKSRYSISLTKALGYGRRSIERVFLRPGTVTVMAASAISVPLCKYIMNYLFPYLVTNFPSGMEVVISAKMYAEIFALIVGTYIVISFILKYQLSRVPLTEILKNVE